MAEESVEAPTTAKQQTEYHVLYRLIGGDSPDWIMLVDDAEQPVVVRHKGAPHALRHAVTTSPTLSTLALLDDGIEIVTVPVRSWQPTPVRLVQELRFG